VFRGGSGACVCVCVYEVDVHFAHACMHIPACEGAQQHVKALSSAWVKGKSDLIWIKRVLQALYILDLIRDRT